MCVFPLADCRAVTDIDPKNGKGTKRKRGGRAPGSGDDVEGEDAEDWTRQRKDNHVCMAERAAFLNSLVSCPSLERSRTPSPRQY